MVSESTTLEFAERRRNAAREKLRYYAKAGITDQRASGAEAEFAEWQKKLDSLRPDPVSDDPRSVYFIGPTKTRGRRGDGPTIVCFRCRVEKPRCDFYEKGTVCRKCTAERSVQWAEKNPERHAELRVQINERCRDKKNAKAREVYHRDIEATHAKQKVKRETKRESINRAQREYLRRRKAKDPKWRAYITCRRRMWILFKSVGRKKTLRSAELLGIDREGFFRHIESLFLPGMTWDNRGHGKGCWHIDHKIPCASFDMTDDAQAKACWNYTNLQPMWAEDNWEKSDKIIS